MSDQFFVRRHYGCSSLLKARLEEVSTARFRNQGIATTGPTSELALSRCAVLPTDTVFLSHVTFIVLVKRFLPAREIRKDDL